MQLQRLLASGAGAVLVVCGVLEPAWGWGAHRHRTITYLALDGLPAEAPAWLREEGTRRLIAEQSNEPDRWRGTRVAALSHDNNPDHYLDIEELEKFGLTLQTLPRLRYEFVREMSVAMAQHPERFADYDPSKDADNVKMWPGFAPHAIAEHYAKLRSSFNTLRVVEIAAGQGGAAGGAADYSALLELARANVVHEMGVLSHFVGDVAQPLHTTIHHHGWVGENAAGYTTDYGFHAYIDSGVVSHHRIDEASLKPAMTYGVQVNQNDPWPQVIEYLGRSFAQVEPLYKLQKSGELEKEVGKALIEERMRDAASMLGALYAAAWKASEPTDEQVASFVRFSK